MDSEYTRREFKHELWERGEARYGIDPPNRVNTFVQNWSNDKIISSGHRYRGKFDGSDLGGAFHVVKRYYSDYNSLTGDGSKAVDALHPWGPGFYAQRTPLFAYRHAFNNSHFPVVEPTNLIELIAMGSDAISLVAPTNKQFDGATFILEMREGLPHIIPFAETSKRRTSRARSAGGEYLNVKFGWEPLLRDYHSFSESVKRAESILDEYEKNSGKLLIRKFSWPVDRKVEVERGTRDTFASPLIDENNLWTDGGYLGDHETITTSTTKRWFVGAFKYYFPKRGDPLRKTSELNKLYGTDVTPETLWNAAPWSWALDWVGNAGTLARNLSVFQTDGLVMPYAYLMEQKSVKKEYTVSNLRLAHYPEPFFLRQTFETVCKYRIQASPYGFDVD